MYVEGISQYRIRLEGKSAVNKLRLKIIPALWLSFSLLLSLVPAAHAETAGRSLRLHYVNETVDYVDLGVWVWGGVVTPSESVGAWPGGRTLFPEENTGPDGTFVDIPLKEDAADIGVLVIDGAGNKRTPEDVLIPPRSSGYTPGSRAGGRTLGLS